MSFLVMLAFASRTDGYICMGPDQAALPLLESPAPLNAHIWLFLPTDYKTIKCKAPPCEGRFAVRPAAGVTPAYDIPIETVRETTNGGITTVELVPADRLPPRTLLETWWVPEGQRSPRLLSVFKTGDVSDRTAPSAPVPTRAFRYVAGSPISGDLGDRQIVIEGQPATDDGRPASLYAVWVEEGASTPLSFSRPPDVIINRELIDREAVYKPRFLVLGTGSGCVTTFTLPKSSKLHLGIRALDVAGNLGPPAEVVVPN